MSWRDRLSTLFVSRPLPENPDEPIEIGVVPITRGPLAVSHLREAGFEAGGHDAFNIVSNVASGYRILVPRRQSEEAVAVLGDWLAN
jgi:hypothetical protein